MAFSVIFRVPGQMSRFRGHFPPVSRFCAPLCRAGNSREEKLTAGSFSSEIFYQKCPCPRKCPNGHKLQICACFIGFCTSRPQKFVKNAQKTRHKNPPQPGRPSAYLLVKMLPMAAMTAGETIQLPPLCDVSFPKSAAPHWAGRLFSLITKCQPFFHRNFDKNACFLSPHCLLYSYKNSGCFLCRSSAWAPPGRTEVAA